MADQEKPTKVPEQDLDPEALAKKKEKEAKKEAKRPCKAGKV